MADRYYDDFEPEDGDAAAAGGVRRLASAIGAVVSVSLVLGLGLWSYRLMVRDVSGVPVVRALEGPSRISPDDPGGAQAAHQGLSVNRIAAIGEAAPPPDRVVLSPRPIDLSDEDRPMPPAATATATAPAARPVATASGTGPRDSDSDIVRASYAPDAATDARPTDTAALVPTALGIGGAAANDGGAADLADDAVAAALAAEKAAEAAQAAGGLPPAGIFGTALESALAEAMGLEGAILRSPRPRLRPATGTLRNLENLAATTAASPTATAAPIDPDSLAPGTRLVQLGAFDTEADAQAEWDRLSARFAAYLGERQKVVQQAESGGRSFYRLRAAGFADEGDARRFCAALLAEQATCIPVLIR